MKSLTWYRSQFPEDLYPCNPKYMKEYTERVLHGYERARNSTLVIAGLVRDCERILPNTLARLERLAEHFYDCCFVFFENDSKDISKEILLNWSPNYEKHVTSIKLKRKKFESVKCADRIDAMSFYRSRLQSKVKDIIDGDSFDYVILLDTDLEGGFSYEGLFNSLSYDKDVIASNSLFYRDGIRHYYDSYALRTMQDDSNIDVLNRGEPLIRVKSAFGGLCLHKTKAYLDGEYFTEDPDKWCEHQGFYKDKDIYINPSQITLYNSTRYCI